MDVFGGAIEIPIPPEVVGEPADRPPEPDVVVTAGLAAVAFFVLRVPPTAPPITAPSTTIIARVIKTIPLVVRQKGTVFVLDECPFSSFEAETESSSGSD